MSDCKVYKVIGMLLFLWLWCNLPLYSQPASSPLRGDMIVEHLEDQAVKPQQAYNGVLSFENLINGGAFINNEPQILYTLAKYKIFLGYKHKEVNYAANNPQDYSYFEPDDIYIYKGKELQRIIDEYPASPIADDAVYMLATLPFSVECDGDKLCILRNKIQNYQPMLVRFNSSPFFYNAILDINETLDNISKSYIRNLDPKKKQELVSLLSDYTGTLADISNDHKVYTLHSVAKIYRKMGNTEKAKPLYQEIVQSYPNYPQFQQAKYELENLD